MSREKQLSRKYAAKIERELASTALDDDFGFASHITHDDKLKYAEKKRILAGEIESGLHDNNHAVWQRMNYFLTGETIAFLPKW